MHARKAHEQLNRLIDAAPADLATFTQAAVLIERLLKLNRRPEEGRPNETVKSKLQSARGWFEILCGVGEDGAWREDDLRHYIRCDLATAADNFTEDGSCYKSWPPLDEN